MSRFCSSSKRAFSLVEILVVVAVLALLSAILFPALSRAREGGRRVVCSSNLHQLALAMNQYIGDNGGRFPPRQFVEAKQTWVSSLLPYTKSEATFQCPDAGSPSAEKDNDKREDHSWVADVAHGWSVESSGSYGFPKGLGTLSAFRVKEPTRKLLFADSSWYQIADPRRDGGEMMDALRHNGGLNIAFVDGHVHWESWEQSTGDVQP